MTVLKLCGFDGCDKEYHARGYCHLHYCKLIKYGSPHGFGRTAKGVPHDFMNNVAATCTSAECLTWPYSKRWHGRAQINMKGKMCEVHRVVCEMIHGPAPSPIHEAAHSCGNGHLSCVNGSHLSWKTPKENAADKKLHGTYRFGESHHIAKLTDQKVAEIKSLCGIESHGQIAKRFDVSRSLISMILSGKIWSHII